MCHNSSLVCCLFSHFTEIHKKKAPTIINDKTRQNATHEPKNRGKTERMRACACPGIFHFLLIPFFLLAARLTFFIASWLHHKSAACCKVFGSECVKFPSHLFVDLARKCFEVFHFLIPRIFFAPSHTLPRTQQMTFSGTQLTNKNRCCLNSLRTSTFNRLHSLPTLNEILEGLGRSWNFHHFILKLISRQILLLAVWIFDEKWNEKLFHVFSAEIHKLFRSQFIKSQERHGLIGSERRLMKIWCQVGWGTAAGSESNKSLLTPQEKSWMQNKKSFWEY